MPFPLAAILFAALTASVSPASAQAIRVGSFTKISAVGTQTVSHGLGQTPKALILWTDGKTGSTFSANFLYAFGMADGTTSKSVAVASQSGVGATPVAARRMANKALTIINWNPTIIAEADLLSWNATGFTLNWTTNTAATGYVVHFIAIGGPTVSAKVVGWTMRTSAGNRSVTGVGFTPDVVLHAHLGDGFTTAPPSSSTGAHFGLGVMDKSNNQWAVDAESVNGVPAVTTRAQDATACIYGTNSSRVVVKRATLVTMDADGFTVNFSTANVNASQVISLALKGVAARVGSFLKSTTAPGAAYVQSRTTSTTADVASANVTFPTTTAGNLIVVSFDFHQPAVVSSVVDDRGNTYRRAIGPTNWGPSPDRMYTYYAKNITGGATTVTVNLSAGSSGWLELFASEYQGIDTTDPLDQTHEATGSGGDPMASGTVTTTSPDEILYAACGADTGTITLTAPFTQRRNPNGNPIGDASVTSIGTYNLTSSIDDTGDWICQLVSFRHAAAKQSVTGVGFSPDAVLLASFQDVVQANPVAQSRLGLGVMDGSFNQGSSAWADRDAAGTTSVQGIDKTTRAFMKVNNSTSTINAEAVPYSFDGSGFTLDWTTNDAVATQILYLALAAPKPGSYARFRSITVPTSSLGASCTTSLTNFPLLVSLSGPDADELRTVADGGYVQNANGYDIVFTDGSNNPLDHEIEQYTSTPGGATLLAWVRLPTLSVLGPTTIFMRYGNPSITSPTANPAGVWDGSYKAVWHMKETGAGAAGEYKDSTGYGNHGQGGAGVGGAVPTQAAGQIGFGQSFDGSDDFIDAGADASLNITGPITLETWVQLRSVRAGGGRSAVRGEGRQYAVHPQARLGSRRAHHVLRQHALAGLRRELRESVPEHLVPRRGNVRRHGVDSVHRRSADQHRGRGVTDHG